MGMKLVIAKFIIFTIVRLIFNFIQTIIWLLDGTYSQVWKSRKAASESWCTQVLDIKLRCKLDEVLQPSGPENFITTHERFVDPSYVLKDNVTLYYLTSKQAVFVETKEGLDVSLSDYGSFLRVAQFHHARKVLIMPAKQFHKLAESIGDPKGTILFLTNCSRCGSTLMSQIFEETGRCISFSEPDALNVLATYRGKMPKDELHELIRNCVRVQCKPITGRDIDLYLIKPTAPTIDAVPTLIEIFPKSKQLFMYREGIKVGQSLFRLTQQLPLAGLTGLFATLHPLLTKLSFKLMGLSSAGMEGTFKNKLIFTCYMWAWFCHQYVDQRKKGCKIDAVKYDDMMKNKRKTTEAIFEYVGLSLDLVDRALAAFNRDSQAKSVIGRKNIGGFKVAELSPEDKVDTDAFCDKFGFARIPEPCNLEGTITSLE